MSNVTNLFNYSRTLPEPFDTLKSKKIKVSSKYGDGTQSTLCATVIKAINAACACMNHSGEGAYGTLDLKGIAEYSSSNSPNEFHIVVYDSTNGALLASVYDKSTEVIESYVVHSSARDGAAIMMAMLPALLEDEEFKENFDLYYDQFLTGFTDMTTTTNAMAYMCDNAYRRIKDDGCSAHVPVEIEKSGNIMRVARSHIDSGSFTPNTVLGGEFTIFGSTGPAPIKKASTFIDHTDFVNKYHLNSSRVLTPEEEMMVPKLPEWYIIPPEVVDICKHAQCTTGKSMQMRNFLLRGPAGTGKTMGAKAVAAGLGLPYKKYTCSAGTEIYDFIGQIFPDAEAASTGNAKLDYERQQLKAMGGINYANVAKLMNLPDLDDMDYDPQGVYKALTGQDKSDASTQDCMKLVLEKVTKKISELSKSTDSGNSQGQSFTYVETDFLMALKNGYVVEVQEPTTIMQPGVLVGLNSLLEQTGSITLPTGEVIERHPDAVVIVTTNISYEGCRDMNQSVIDRMSLICDVEAPAPEVMIQRAMSVTGATDEYQVSQMVQVVNDIAQYCRTHGVTDGSYGMRSLIDWIESSAITNNVYESALYTVISKATTDEMEREAIKTTVLEPIFAPTRKRATA